MSLIDAIEMAEGVAIDETHEGYLDFMDRSGHAKTAWSINNPEEVAIARAAFEKARELGYTIYRVNGEGEPETIMERFEPEAGRFMTGKYVARPQMRGG